MSYPWAVKANTRTVRNRDKARLPVWRLRRKSLRLFVFLALSGASSILDAPTARAEPPPTALPQQGTVTSGTASIQSIANAMMINQQSQKVIIKWQSFNIGRDASVEFKQPDSSSVAVNRILQGSPSEIFGRLSANGQVYLINQNGILFGKSAQIDTHTLVASTLPISDEILNTTGLTNAINQDKAAFEGTGAMGLIKIESGAVLKSAEGGRIMIFAPEIENHGDISTPGGQAVLAASQDKVYLANSDDENLRGLLVEVDTGGSVTNLGKIIAERGNVSLIGLAVNQNGVVRATTSVSLNGSIRLVARDKATVLGEVGHKQPQATRTGTLTLGAGSLTEVAPDNLAQTAVDAQKQPHSRIDLMGKEVMLKSGARIVSPGGDVNVTATQNPQDPGPSTINAKNGSTMVMESGSHIDVSGLSSAVLPMERNVIAVELRGNELRDSPLQRNGPLRGETVYVDVRKGTPLADVSGQIATIQRPLDERLSAGGKVSIVSEGDFAMREGSTIDVSGGAIRYQDGYVNTTQLISQGKVYDIGVADPNRPYDGIYGTYKLVHKKWGVTETFNVFGSQVSARYEQGYVEGKDAGTAEINARDLDLHGTLRGETVTGRYQRLLPSATPTGVIRGYDELPLGGLLIFGNASQAQGDLGLTDFTLRSLTDLGATGFNRLRVYANGRISVPGDAQLALSPGGELSLTAGHVEVQGDITAPGGSVKLKARETTQVTEPTADLTAGGRIDVAGLWVNDSTILHPTVAAEGPAVIDGGSVTVEAAGDVALEAGSVIDAGGGAQLQRNGKLKYGKGGQIIIASTPSSSDAVVGESSDLRLEGELRAYSFNKGGSLSLTGAGYRIGGNAGAAPAHMVTLTPDFFERGGFNSYKLTATHTGITLAQNTDVRLRARNRVIDPSFNLQPTGTDLNRLGSPGFLPDYQQQPVSLELSLARTSNVGDTARVEMESGSSIHANPGASIALTSDTQLIVDGTIAAPAGDIRLTLTQPNSNNERGFDPSQAIWLGPNGQLLAKADFQSIPDSSGRGLRKATVQDGGTVTVAAERGYFVADKDSLIDVSGASQTLDVVTGSQVQPTLVSAAAGAIDLLAAEGMVLNGELRGAPGNGAGAAGGALSVTLDHNKRGGSTDFGPYPTGTREIILSSTGASAPAIGAAVPAALSGIVRLDPEKVRRGGFDRLSLRSLSANTADPTAAKIKLEGDVRLDVAQRLVLDAPVLESDGGNAEFAAAYVALGTKTRFDTTSINPTAGNGSLWVRGQHVDLIGTLALRGFGPDGAAADAVPVRIESEGDIRLIGGDQIENGPDGLFKADREGIFAAGRLNSAADIELRADQVYTATATDYTLSVTGTDGKITIRSGGENVAPLSAGSKLTLTADHIEQHGTLRAPFGQIELDAARSLVLGDGSVTSVSGSGQVVPFGITEFGQDWLYPLVANSKKVYTAPPEKRITMKAPEISLAPGSVVDVTGGGDLQAREHLPGPGGSNDVLDIEYADGAFAIVPTQNNPFGSYDPFLSTGSPAQTGDTIHLAGGGPLAAGEYAVLPAGYALLPGAYLITPLAKTNSPLPGQALQQYDGSAIVAGQRGVAGTNTRDSLWSAFRIENGAQIRNRAEYLENRADSFFAANGDRLNRDAGRLVIDAGTALALGGTLASNATGGRGSEVDILADDLAVVASRTGASNRVELLASGLNNLNADSLLLGASRQQQGRDVALDVRANDVTVESGAAVAAPEVMLAAKDLVAVADGATITAADGDRVRTPETILLSGDSALARISSGEQVRIQRQSSPGTTGTLDIVAGATLDASRSITLDASRDTAVDGELRTHNGSLSMTASRISLGETQGITSGLVLSNERLTSIDARDLTLNSRSTVDLYGQVSLKDLSHVALDAAGLAGYRNAGVGQGTSINADTITLSNRSGRIYATTAIPDGTGSLNLTAREVILGEGDFSVRGFSNTTVSATEQIIARPETDTPVKLHVAGDLTLQTSRIAASKGADVRIDTQPDVNSVPVGKITLTTPNEIVTLNPVTDLGAKLDLVATEIGHGTHIELPSGIATLHATTGNVIIENNASIDVSGRDLHFADITVGTPGGNANLIADHGNVSVGAARIDVSGASTGGDAGKLSIIAPEGIVQLDPTAQLDGSAQAGNRAGSFALDARILANNFSTLNAALNVSGFSDGRQFRLRSGDISIDTDILAHDLRIAADAGKIDVLGRIDASGTQAGQVALYARDGVSLHGSSSIDAQATGAGEKGGSVTLASTVGRLNLQADASINVAGTDETGTLPTDTGTVHLRAAREGASGVAVDPIAANITGADRIEIEAYKTYTASNIDSGLIATIQGDTTAFMNNAAPIENAVGMSGNALFHLVPGVEIQSSGSLSLNTDWDLFGSGWHYGGKAGVLTLRAAGDLNLNASLSDGVAFASLLDGVLLRETAQTGPSWSYRLAGGADLAGADPLSVERGTGDVALASNTKVRTGTGDIEIAAGRDLRLADSTAAIYTVGENRGTGAIPDSADFPAEVVKELFLKGDFLHHGGDIRITAGRNVIGADGRQFINDWLSRVGGVAFMPSGENIDLPAAWAVNIAEFRQNIGALGGGNINVIAQGDIDDLSVAIPTTGMPAGGIASAPDIAGGGDLRIEAGGDIRSGVFYLGKGRARITAGGSVTRQDNESVYPILALGDGQYALRARKNLVIESVVNPTVLIQNPLQAYSEFVMTPASYFFTYTDDSAVHLEAIAGDALLRGDTNALWDASEILKTSGSAALGYYPGSLGVRSLQGDIVVGGSGFTLFPAPRGNLEMLAKNNIVPGSDNTVVLLSDTDPGLLPNPLAPSAGMDDAALKLAVEGPDVHAATPVHQDDTQPIRIVAQTGIVGSQSDSVSRLTLELSKQARISAGKDVRNLRLRIQHVDVNNISLVEAGDSVLFPTKRDGAGQVSASESFKDLFEIAGPGQFYVIAGKDVDLGASQGIVSVGDQKNPALSDSGASVTVMAGIDPTPDYDAFVQRYLIEDNVYHERLAQFMTELGSTATGVDAFQALPLVQQRKFILKVFFNELRESGIAAVDSKNYERGFDAIKTLFPAEGYDGDVKSFLSRIYTLDDGDINLVVPGGLANAGVASATGIDKPAGQLGIVAQRQGGINAFVHSDFLVNKSRVFALDGGDILIWSSTGDIDAGKGAKTALSVPPVTTTFDENGNAVVEFPPSISGSGIRAAVSTPDREPGEVILVAPVGVINAGDAGIGSAGNLTIAATAVVGADNIQVGGASVGVPTDTGGLGAGLVGVGDIAATANKVAEDATRGLASQTNERQGFLGVEVLGFGE